MKSGTRKIFLSTADEAVVDIVVSEKPPLPYPLLLALKLEEKPVEDEDEEVLGTTRRRLRRE